MVRRRRVRARLPRSAARSSWVATFGRRLAHWPWLRARVSPEADADRLLGTAAVTALGVAALLSAAADGARAIAAVPLGLALGWRAGVAVYEREGRAHAAEVRRALPVTLDRLTTCVLAGMTIERALGMAARGAPSPLRSAIEEGLRSLQLGAPRVDAYERIARAARAPEMRGVMVALARAERFGTPVAAALSAQASALRAQARAAGEAAARTAPVKLVFPLVFCFLPAFVLLAVAPIALQAVRTLGGM